MDKRLLSEAEIKEALTTLTGWDYDAEQKCLSCSCHFASFSECFAMMTKIALLCERQNHHPDWFNSYRKLDIRLTSHDAGGITTRDIVMAKTLHQWGIPKSYK